MAATEVTIQVGQAARVVLTPVQNGQSVAWPGGQPQWSVDNQNVRVTPDPTGLQADILGLSAGDAHVLAVGGYAYGPQAQTVQANITVHVTSPYPEPDDFAVSAVAKPIAVG